MNVTARKERLTMASRDDRIETYYQESAWQLAEWLVDLEDELAELKENCDGAE